MFIYHDNFRCLCFILFNDEERTTSKQRSLSRVPLPFGMSYVRTAFRNKLPLHGQYKQTPISNTCSQVICKTPPFTNLFYSNNCATHLSNLVTNGVSKKFGFDSHRGTDIFVFTTASITAVGNIQPPVQFESGVLFLTRSRLRISGTPPPFSYTLSYCSAELNT